MDRSKTKRSAEDETIAETMARRMRETFVDPKRAEAAAHEAFARSLRSGQPLNLPTPSDVRAFGRAILDGKPGEPPAMSKTLGGKAGDMVKTMAEDLALKGGVAVGGVQRVRETALGTAETLKFANRLFNPLDIVAPPDGKPAWAQLGDGAADLLYDAGNAIAHPVATAQTIYQQGATLARQLDPSLTPKATTFGDEMNRKFNIGRAQGRLAVDVASLAGVAAPAKLAGKLDLLKAPSVPEKYMKQGFSPGAARYLAEPYKGMGHHTVFARRYRLPDFLGGGPIPERISESLYNVLKPEGITRGDFYELHYAADGKFHGTGLPRQFAGESWSGKRLGLTKAPPGIQQWKGTPTPTKTRVGGAVGIVGGQTYDRRRP